MKHYIIDGNNLIGKIKELSTVQKKDKQSSRVKLAMMIDNYFDGKKANVTLHYDGFENEPVKVNSGKIVYSGSGTADDNIKNQISESKNSKNLVVITSDSNLAQFARVCSSSVIPSEKFAVTIKGKRSDDETKIINDLKKNSSEFEKLFGIDDE